MKNREEQEFFEDENFLESVNRFENMLKNNTKEYFDVDEFENIIDYYLFKNNPKNASEVSDIAYSQHPDSIIIQLKRSQVLIDTGRPTEAINILKRLELIETNIEIFLLKGSAYNILGMTKEAIRNFEIGLTMHEEDNAELLYKIAQAFQHTNKFKIALGYLKLAYESNSQDLNVLYDLAFCYERVGTTEKSILFYEKYLDLEPFSQYAWYNLGINYNNNEQYIEAVDAYDFAIAIDDKYSSAYFNKANTLANSEMYEEAIEAYKEFISLNENYAQAHFYIGECYDKLDNPDESTKHYLKAIEIDKDFSDGWYGIALVLLNQKKYQESLKNILIALNIEKDNSEHWFVYGKVQAKMELYNQAVVAFTKAIDLDPEDIDAWIERSEALFKTGKISEAIESLLSLLKTDYAVADVYYYLTAYLLEEGKIEEALKNLKEALELDYDMHIDFIEYYQKSRSFPEVVALINKFRER